MFNKLKQKLYSDSNNIKRLQIENCFLFLSGCLLKWIAEKYLKWDEFMVEDIYMIVQR